ncbi:MAG: acetoacetate decarboxylase family protein [Rhodoferax sp.]
MSTNHNDPFFQVPRTVRPTSEGDVEFPILYFRTRCVQAFFWSPVALVEKHLAGTGLTPGLVWRGKAVVGLAFFEYSDTSIGVYNEVGLALPAVPDGAPGRRWLGLLEDVESPRHVLGFHVAHLPVTTAAACAAGREIWGYPKFVTPIPFQLSGHDLETGVADPATAQTSICELSGRMGVGVPGPTLSLLLYSRLGAQRLRTTVNVRGNSRLHRPGSVRLQLGASSHPMNASLRDLGLQGAQPLVLSVTENFQSRLNLGREY